MKLKEIVGLEFNSSFENLINGSILDMSMKTASILKAVGKKVRAEQKNIEEMRLDICKQLADKDEAGEPIMLPDNRFKMTSEAETTLKKKLDELLEVEVELISQKIDYKDVEKLKLSVKDLIALDGIISDPV